MTNDLNTASGDAAPQSKRYYITTPIYYVNGAPHIGTATTTVLADATTRYRKLRGDNAYFLTGTDENAKKVTNAAEDAGKSPHDFVDEVSQRFVEAWKLLGCDYDVFIRTTEERHFRAVQEVFTRLLASDDVYLGTYEGWYSVADETFFRDTDVDAATQTARETGAKVERVQEEAYFFRLSRYGDRLREYIVANPDFLLPETRRNEVLSFIDEGLRDINITQNRSGWGIPVPGDPNKIIYVWFDALINYLTVTGWPAKGWETLWPADAHLMGKEIYRRFHATLWPAMLMALDLPLPRHVVGHGWWLVRDPNTLALVKGSKSGVPLPLPEEMVALLQEQSGAPQEICVDALRYYLLRDIHFSADAEFNVSILLGRFNSDLANDLGNVLNRVLRAKYFDGVIPTPRAHDAGLIETARAAVTGYEKALETFDWGEALQSAWTLVAAVNKYLDDMAPWVKVKEGDLDGVNDAIYNALEGARLAAVLLSPVLPHATRAMGTQLGVTNLTGGKSWDELTRWGGLVSGSPIGEPTPLFPRIDLKAYNAAQSQNKPAAPKKDKKMSDDITNAIVDPGFAPVYDPNNKTTSAPAALVATDAPVDDEDEGISIDDFLKVQLRVAEIISAEKISGAKKLLRLQIRLGDGEERQLVAGIAEAYKPDELPGKKIVVVANLQTAVIRGVESRGMLLAATDEDGLAVLLTPEKPVPAGSGVR